MYSPYCFKTVNGLLCVIQDLKQQIQERFRDEILGMASRRVCFSHDATTVELEIPDKVITDLKYNVELLEFPDAKVYSYLHLSWSL